MPGKEFKRLMSDVSEYDGALVAGTIVVFALPLTLLIPGFSVWDVVPKFRVTRFHIFSGIIAWSTLNIVVVTTLVIFFGFYLEIRKRKLDDMVESVLTVSQATDATMALERDRQSAAVKACVDLLDASTEHYENLVLLRDELRKRDKMKKHRPPAIELTPSELA